VRTWAIALLPVLLATTVWSHRAVKQARDEFPRDQDVLYLPPAQHLRPMSLGYREALADLIWIRAVLFTGDRSSAGAGNHVWILEYLEAIHSLAPRFRRPYAWSSVVLLYMGEATDRAVLDRALGFYRRGIEQYPEDHELLFSAGMLLIGEVQAVPGYTEAERAAAHAEGVALIGKAAAFGAPRLVRELATTLVSQGGADQLAIQFLEGQLLQAEDEDHRRLIRQKLAVLIGEAGFDSLERLRAEFEADRLAKAAYVPADVWALVRE
jgi:hypothetical protein